MSNNSSPYGSPQPQEPPKTSGLPIAIPRAIPLSRVSGQERPKTSGLAIASLVLGLLGFVGIGVTGIDGGHYLEGRLLSFVEPEGPPL